MRHLSPCCNVQALLKFTGDCEYEYICPNCGREFELIAEAQPVNWGRIAGMTLAVLGGFIGGTLWCAWIMGGL